MSAPTIDRLRGVPLFAGLDDDALEGVAARVGEFEVAPGTVMVEVAQPGTGLFVVEEGEARVDLPGGGHAMLGPGDFFGELALLDGGPRAATVVADSPLTTIRIERTAFRGLLRTEPDLALKVLEGMARRTRTILGAPAL